jgi:hypothetical protein
MNKKMYHESLQISLNETFEIAFLKAANGSVVWSHIIDTSYTTVCYYGNTPNPYLEGFIVLRYSSEYRPLSVSQSCPQAKQSQIKQHSAINRIH